MPEKKYGWQGKLLWIDLKDKSYKDIDVRDLCEDYMGARGLAIKMAWEHMKPGTKAFDDENLLMFMVGPCTATPTFGSGRGYIFCVGGATYPDHFTRSSMGGRWSSGIKFAGYDGIIIKNKSENPVLIEIAENKVIFHDATNRYWGKDINTTEQLVREDFGPDSDCCMIGPAGENLVRWASVMCNTGHAAGQGGMGSVMGDKKVKALVFTGHDNVKVSDFEKINDLRQEALRIWGFEKGLAKNDANFISTSGQEAIEDGDLTYVSTLNVACRGCGARCHNVNTYFRGLKGRYYENAPTGTFKCLDTATIGWPANTDLERNLYLEKLGRSYRWPFDLRSGLETVAHTNNMGLNSWEFQSIYLWLTELEMEGIDVSEFIGMKWDVNDPTLMPRLVLMCAHREGCGDMFAEGIARLEEKLGGVYKKYSPHAFNGFCTHSLGTDCWWYFRYPYWVPVALQYAIDSRDPISDSGHRYVFLVGQHYGVGKYYEDAAKIVYGIDNAIGPYYKRRKCEFYPEGDIDEDIFDDLAYANKEVTAYKNTIRGVVIGCGVLCDRYYPIYGDPKNEENNCLGDLNIEAEVMSAVTGVDYTTEIIEKNAERIYNMERCYSIAEHNRNKAFDMQICRIQPRGDWTTGKKIDKVRFEALLDRFYDYAGWDENGVPREETLKALGLDEINEIMKKFRQA